MTRLFGTDGIRGIANVDLKPTLAYALGRATAVQLLTGRGPLLVGQDTRRSGDMLVAGLVAGATSMGADVHRLGICPTPALSFVTGELDYAAGVMVSASHNPADDNGLKVLDAAGMKLDERAEDELEALLWRADELPSPTNAELGRDIDARAGLDRYRAHRLGLAAQAKGDVRVVLDCANGSAGPVAPDILAATGARVSVHFASPDGVNINLGCGATAPGALAAMVAAEGADVGFALDGDADRCVAIDELGQVVDGDQLLGIVALDRLARGALSAATLVVSVLSNGGLAAVVERAGGRVQRTRVGDKYILDAMLVSGAGVGGEKSGHVIIREHSTSGDGIVTALEVLSIMARTGRRLSELARDVPLFPQQQRAVPVRFKDQWEADPELVAAVRDAETELTGRGRVLVRPSGTEPALRIMVEGEDASRVLELADALASLAANRLNQPT
ncbi:MAG: phosphoglucosamine mutase [Chloroflexi bacterium]|nr:phosphoglucosamine mutase [Chloroflexota bacterium]